MRNFDVSRPATAVLDISPLAQGMAQTLGTALQRELLVSSEGAAAVRLDYAVREMQFKGRGGFERLHLGVCGSERRFCSSMLTTSAARLAAMLAELVPDTLVGQPDPVPLHPLLARPIDDLELGVRSFNCLRQRGIAKIGDLIGQTESDLLKLPHLGRRGLEEIRAALASRGLLLGSRRAS